MKICNNCNSEVNDDSIFCPNCGNKFIIKECPSCGKELKDNEKFCSSCGTEYKDGQEKTPTESNIINNKDSEESTEENNEEDEISIKAKSSLLSLFAAGGCLLFIAEHFLLNYIYDNWSITIIAVFGISFILLKSFDNISFIYRTCKYGMKYFSIVGVFLFVVNAIRINDVSITYDPVKDSKTYIEILKHDEKEAEDYALIVIAAYRQQGKKEDADRFIRLTADELNNYLMDMMN